jgi:hypothetical protein
MEAKHPCGLTRPKKTGFAARIKGLREKAAYDGG